MGHKINIICYVSSLLLTYFLLPGMFLPVLVVCTALFIAILTFGVLNIKLNYFLVSRSKSESDACILTFDDGPHPVHTPAVLDILQATGTQAIFFLIGKNAAQHPEIVQRILAEGHVIGNHSFSHDKLLPCFSTSRLTEDLRKCQAVLENISGKDITLFRPPFGITNPNYKRSLKRLGLRSIGWSLRTFDTVRTDPQYLYKQMVTRVKKGDVILMHDTQEVTVAFLESFIVSCRQNGMFFALPEKLH